MASFAQLDNNNKIINVVVINNVILLDENNVEQENLGVVFLKSLFGENTNWKQSSYNAGDGIQKIDITCFRKNVAVIDGYYSPELDAFIPPAPYDNWIWNEKKCSWEAPMVYPDDGIKYFFNKETRTWFTDDGIPYNWNADLQIWENRIY